MTTEVLRKAIELGEKIKKTDDTIAGLSISKDVVYDSLIEGYKMLDEDDRQFITETILNLLHNQKIKLSNEFKEL